jgi:hypothetical protein
MGAGGSIARDVSQMQIVGPEAVGAGALPPAVCSLDATRLLHLQTVVSQRLELTYELYVKGCGALDTVSGSGSGSSIAPGMGITPSGRRPNAQLAHSIRQSAVMCREQLRASAKVRERATPPSRHPHTNGCAPPPR